MRSGAAVGVEGSKLKGGRTTPPFFDAVTPPRFYKKAALFQLWKRAQGLFARENGMTAWVAPCRGLCRQFSVPQRREKGGRTVTEEEIQC